MIVGLYKSTPPSPLNMPNRQSLKPILAQMYQVVFINNKKSKQKIVQPYFHGGFINKMGKIAISFLVIFTH